MPAEVEEPGLGRWARTWIMVSGFCLFAYALVVFIALVETERADMVTTTCSFAWCDRAVQWNSASLFPVAWAALGLARVCVTEIDAVAMRYWPGLLAADAVLSVALAVAYVLLQAGWTDVSHILALSYAAWYAVVMAARHPFARILLVGESWAAAILLAPITVTPRAMMQLASIVAMPVAAVVLRHGYEAPPARAVAAHMAATTGLVLTLLSVQLMRGHYPPEDFIAVGHDGGGA